MQYIINMTYSDHICILQEERNHILGCNYFLFYKALFNLKSVHETFHIKKLDGHEFSNVHFMS